MKKIISIILTFILLCSLLISGEFFAEAATVSIKYSAHVQNIGWQGWVSNGKTAGTTGKSKRMEAIKIQVSGLKSGTVKYRTHIQGTGWQAWKSSGNISGTVGKSLRVEAIQIKLTGDYVKKYDVIYRAHVQGFGWLSWTKNGSTAGTTGISYRMEAIQIKLAKKGSVKTSGKAYITSPTVSYSSHVQNIGWQSTKTNGATSGTTGQSKRLEAIKITCKNLSGIGCVNYSAHVQDIGWQGWVSSGKVAGTTGKSKRMEAIKIKLDNTMSSYFDVYYRVHISNYGWLAWTKNGAIAGSTGISIPIEAIQIKVLSNADTSIKTGGTAYITSKKLSYNSSYIAKTGNQKAINDKSGMCGAFATAYCRCILDNSPKNAYDYWGAGGAQWSKGGGSKVYTSSLNDSLSRIKTRLDSNRPSILLMGSTVAPNQHYVTIIGYKNNGAAYSDFYILDPYDGTEKMLNSYPTPATYGKSNEIIIF